MQDNTSDMSGKLNPSRSTVYVSNLPFSLTNNDLHKLFEEYGTVVKVTVLKDRITRKSRGVAFVLFLKRQDAQKCTQDIHGKEVYGRTLKASIAIDNGRSTEFIRKRIYKDKSSCYECGEEGHLSYKCPKNYFGERKPANKKVRRRKGKQNEDASSIQGNVDNDSYDATEEGDHSSEELFEPDLETLSAAIEMEQEKHVSIYSRKESQVKRKKIKQSSYFSDEEDTSD